MRLRPHRVSDSDARRAARRCPSASSFPKVEAWHVYVGMLIPWYSVSCIRRSTESACAPRASKARDTEAYSQSTSQGAERSPARRGTSGWGCSGDRMPAYSWNGILAQGTQTVHSPYKNPLPRTGGRTEATFASSGSVKRLLSGYAACECGASTVTPGPGPSEAHRLTII
jgi:hypothetical protein